MAVPISCLLIIFISNTPEEALGTGMSGELPEVLYIREVFFSMMLVSIFSSVVILIESTYLETRNNCWFNWNRMQLPFKYAYSIKIINVWAFVLVGLILNILIFALLSLTITFPSNDFNHSQGILVFYF